MAKLRIKLMQWQNKVFEALSKFRFVVISAGRQSGKTHLSIFLIFLKASKKKDSINWWVAPTFPVARIAFRRLQKFLADNKIVHKVNKSDACITLKNGATIWFKSGDNENGLRGESVNFLVIDEMGFIKRETWTFALRGTITATNAQVVFIGTPKGKNLFYELWSLGNDSKETEYISFQFQSKDSIYFSDDEWDLVKKLPQRVFEQEYEAKFIDDGGEVFRNIRACIRGDLEPYHKNKYYYMGVDLAKSVDYTVLTVLDNKGHLCAFDRFNSISWRIQKQRIIKLAKAYNAVVYVDSTGLGDPITEDLIYAGLNANGISFTNTNKRQMVENLAIAVEQEEISYPEIIELIHEMNIFTFEQLKSGAIRYSAPDGLHDDIVMSLCLAYHGYSGGKGFDVDAIEFGDDLVTLDMDF